MPVSKLAVSESTMKSAESIGLYFARNAPRLPEPISSSPSITNLTLHGRAPLDCRYDATAATCAITPALSSAVPRPYRRPLRSCGSKGGDSQRSWRPSGCTS
jgi:hypothetical protein